MKILILFVLTYLSDQDKLFRFQVKTWHNPNVPLLQLDARLFYRRNRCCSNQCLSKMPWKWRMEIMLEDYNLSKELITWKYKEIKVIFKFTFATQACRRWQLQKWFEYSIHSWSKFLPRLDLFFPGVHQLRQIYDSNFRIVGFWY